MMQKKLKLLKYNKNIKNKINLAINILFLK